MTPQGELRDFIKTVEMSARRVVREGKRKKLKQLDEDLDVENKNRRLQASSSSTTFKTLSKTESVSMSMVDTGSLKEMADNISGMREMLDKILGHVSVSGDDKAVNVDFSKSNLSQYDTLTNPNAAKLPKLAQIATASELPETLKSSPYLDKLSRLSSIEDISATVSKAMLKKSSDKVSIADYPGELPQRIQPTRDIIRKPTKSSTNEARIRIEEKIGKSMRIMERQGPICWDSSGIRSKYRGEDEREAAWLISLSSSDLQSEMVTTDVTLPVTHLTRHPLYERYYFHATDYNTKSRTDTRSRNRLQQFSLDVSQGVVLFRKSPSSARLMVLRRIKQMLNQDPGHDLRLSDAPYEPGAPASLESDFVEFPVMSELVSLSMAIESCVGTNDLANVRITSFNPPNCSQTSVDCVLWRVSAFSHISGDYDSIVLTRQWAIDMLKSRNNYESNGNDSESAAMFVQNHVQAVRSEDLKLRINVLNFEPVTMHKLIAQQYKLALKACPKLLGRIISLEELLDHDSALWESIVNFNCPNPSMVASNGLRRRSQVPGAFEFGTAGMFWWSDAINARTKLWSDETIKKTGLLIEKTKPSVTCLRDKQLSSQNSVVAIITILIDSPVVSNVEVTWDPQNFVPALDSNEGMRTYSIDVMSRAHSINLEKLVNELDDCTTSLVNIATFDETEAEPAMPASDRGFCVRCCRKIPVEIASQPSYVFGVTRKAATPNFTKVLGTNVWHSLTATNYEIVRPRDFKDYVYIAQNDKHRGPNDPRSFTVRLQHDKLLRIETSGFSEYETEYEVIRQRKLLHSKKEALAKRIEFGTQLHEANLSHIAKAISSDHQMSVERRMRQSVSSERGWKRRLTKSDVVECQDQWQKRRDELTGAIFFHRSDWGAWADEKGTEEKYSVTCQWECPAIWKGDSFSHKILQLPVESVGDVMSSQRSTDSSLVEQGLVINTISNLLSIVESKEVPTSFQASNQISDFMAKDASVEEATVNISDELLNNDSFINSLAQRLGLVEPIATRKSENGNFKSLVSSIMADDNEPWTDSDDENGNASIKELGRGSSDGHFLPQTHADNLKLRSEDYEDEKLRPDKKSKLTKHVPTMDFVGANLVKEIEGGSSLSGHIQGVGWRRVSKPPISTKLIYKCTKPVTLGAPDHLKNTPNIPICLRIVSPVDGISYLSEPYASSLEVLFVSDVRKDVARVLHNMETKMVRERELGKEISTGDLMAQYEDDEGKPKEMTGKTMLDLLLERDNQSVKSGQEPTAESGLQKAIIAVKNGDVSGAEEALEMDIAIDTKDAFGNTLFVLACQQGDFRMSKFLLRRGADINQKNNDGNTALHFCCIYSHDALRDYLISKGADDTAINSDGLTCYEGLRKQDVIEYK